MAMKRKTGGSKGSQAGPRKKSTARFRTENGDMIEFDAAEDDRLNDIFAGDEDEEEEEDDDDDEEDEEIEMDSDMSSDASSEDESEAEEDRSEEDELAEEEDDEAMMRWGPSSLYGGDTADLEIGQDVADAEEEEALAEKIRRRQLEALAASDFALEGEDDVVTNQAVPTLDDGLYGEMLTALNGSSEKAIFQTSLQPLLVQFNSAASQLKELKPMLDTASKLKDESMRPGRLVAVVKEQLLLSLCLNLGFTALLVSEGKDPAEHPVVARLASLRKRLEALGSIHTLRTAFASAASRHVPESTSSEDDPDENALSLRAVERKKLTASEMDQDLDFAEDDEEDAAFEAMPITTKEKKLDAKLMKQARRAARPSGTLAPAGGEDETESAWQVDDDDEEASDSEEDSEKDIVNDHEAEPLSMADDELRFLEAYEAQAKAQRKRKTEKAAKYTVQPRYGAWDATAPTPSLAQDGHRAATREIVENRGLAPRKPKLNRNPRLKRRLKFRKALIRRKGQVRDTIPEATDTVNYGGEVTGIRSKISRSRRLTAAKTR